MENKSLNTKTVHLKKQNEGKESKILLLMKDIKKLEDDAIINNSIAENKTKELNELEIKNANLKSLIDDLK